MGLCSGIGHLMLLQAYTHATPATVAPFLYSQIGFAMLMGWLFFDQRPDGLSLAGIAVILGCGLVNIWLSVRTSVIIGNLVKSINDDKRQ